MAMAMAMAMRWRWRCDRDAMLPIIFRDHSTVLVFPLFFPVY
jgi:hypothetical protein